MGICKYLCLARMLGVGQEQVTLHHAVRMSQISCSQAPLPEGKGFPCCLPGSREALLAGKPEQCCWVTAHWSSNTLGESLHVTSTRCQHFQGPLLPSERKYWEEYTNCSPELDQNSTY